MSPRNKSARERILDHLLANMGEIIEGSELRNASGGISEWARRVRELRTEFGYQILTHRDRSDLKPGQYLLETDQRTPVFTRGVSAETRAIVLERNGYTCQMCGVAAGDPDPVNKSRKARLTLGHIVDKSKGGADTPENLRAVCSACNEGLQNVSPPKPSRFHLLAQIRRAAVDDQVAVYEWLKTKFAVRSGTSE